MYFSFLLNSSLLGIGLAMDALSISVANGLHEPRMHPGKRFEIAGAFAFFQGLMPMLGWFCIHFLMELFSVLRPLIPWLALGLLLFIGGKMLISGLLHPDSCDMEAVGLCPSELLLQGIATSVDALSVGFTIASYSAAKAGSCSLIIASVTFLLCLGSLGAGQRLGTLLCSKSEIAGGCILILIGLNFFHRKLLTGGKLLAPPSFCLHIQK